MSLFTPSSFPVTLAVLLQLQSPVLVSGPQVSVSFPRHPGQAGAEAATAYLLALLDVIVLPDVGATNEHDFELFLVPAVEEAREVLE